MTLASLRIASLGYKLQLAGLMALVSPAAFASSFSITGASTSAQTLGSGSGQTGTVSSSGSLTISDSAVAVTISGSSATLTNLGTINQTGTGRAIRDNTGVTGLVITNGSTTNSTATIQTADADVVQMNKDKASVTLNNYGAMTSFNASAGGSQVVDFNAITTSGSNVVNNYSTGVMTAKYADAVRPGYGGVVNNSGRIISVNSASDTSSDGIDAQNNSGVTVSNYSGGLIEGSRHGITGGQASTTSSFTTTVNNSAGGTIQGDNGSGINLDGFNALQTATIVNNGTIIGNGVSGDGDGIDVDGVVTITNTGLIRSKNAFSSGSVAQSEGVTVGGGTITNSGTIEGLVAAGNANAVGRGITLAGNDITSGALAGTREAIYANAKITNLAGGLIRGDSDSAIYVEGPASGFTVTIDNQAGATLRGGGTVNAAVKTGADNDTLTNAGTIDGSSSGKAVDLGAGNDTMTVTGGSAVILGSIDGGAGNNSLAFNLGAAGNTFSHASTIANFATVTVSSGKVSLNGNNTYTGTTTIGGGAVPASLFVNGQHTGGGAYSVLSGGTLGGTGIIALATAATRIDIQSGGTLYANGGRLTVANGSLNVDGTVKFDLGGASGYDQIAFSSTNTGGITLGSGSTLALNLTYTPAPGQQFELIDVGNDSTFVSGRFAGLADGSLFNVGGQEFQISYEGGTGNDVVVTAIPEPATTAVLAGLGALATVIWLRRRQTA